MRIRCSCGRVLKVSDAYAGRRVRCPLCAAILLAQRPEKAAPTAPASQPNPHPAPDMLSASLGETDQTQRLPVVERLTPRKPARKNKALRILLVAGVTLLLVGGGATALYVSGVFPRQAGSSSPFPEAGPGNQGSGFQPLTVSAEPGPLITAPPRTTLRGAEGFLIAVAFSPDGKTLAAGGQDRHVRLFDVGSGNQRLAVNHEALVFTTAFSPDGQTLASAGQNNRVKLWNATSGNPLPVKIEIPGNPLASPSVFAMMFSPDRTSLACGGGILKGPELKLFDVATGQVRLPLTGVNDLVNAVAFSPDGSLLVSGGMDWNLSLWEASTGKLRSSLKGHGKGAGGLGGVRAVAFSPDGKLVASAGDRDKTVKVWDVATAKELATFPHGGTVISVAFSADSKTLAAGGQLDDAEGKPLAGEIKLWDLTTGRQRGRLTRGKFSNKALFSPDGQTLAVSEEALVHLWDVDKVLP